MVRLLVNHPSIAVWSCQNESTFHNKFIMDPALEMAVALEDGSRYIRATSEFTEHNYPGWYYGDLRDYGTFVFDVGDPATGELPVVWRILRVRHHPPPDVEKLREAGERVLPPRPDGRRAMPEGW